MEPPIRKKLYRHQKLLAENLITEAYPPFSKELQNIIHNTIHPYIKALGGSQLIWDDNDQKFFIQDQTRILRSFLTDIKNEIYLGIENESARILIQRELTWHLFNGSKYSTFDIIQFISFTLQEYGNNIRNSFESVINSLFEIELIPFRIAKGIILETTDEVMIETLKEVLTTNSKYHTAITHIKNSALALSERKPTYEESIRESINAIESLGMIFTGKKQTLSKTLEALKRRLPPHPAFQEAINKLYAWTGDDGIRHGKWPGGESVSYDEAILLLGLSSSLVNYMIKADIKA